MAASLRTLRDQLLSADDSIDQQQQQQQQQPMDIQPLRDLARNFDIDIEPYLEEYLKQTNDLNDDNGTTIERSSSASARQAPPNFAQAALKIQNSIGIYNRKVDFLHQVVYNVLNEFIQSTAASNSANAAGGRKRSSGGAGATDSCIDDFHAFDSELEFLLLDDVLPVDRSAGRKKINLRMDEEENDGVGISSTNWDVNATMATASGAVGGLDTTLATNAGGGMGARVASTPEVTLLSLGGILSASKMDQSGTFVINRESMGKSPPSALSRMLMANLQGGNDGAAGEGNLRLLAGMCDVGANGALLLPGTSVSVFLDGANEAAVAAANAAVSDPGEVQIFPEGLSPNPNASRGSFGVGDSFQDGGGDYGHDDDGDGVGFELNDDTIDNQFENVEEEKKEEDFATVDPEEEKIAATKKKVNDPWALLDPHEPSNDKAQPLRIGVTYRLPRGLDDDDRPSALVNGSRTRTRVTKKKNETVHHERGQAIDDMCAPPFLADVTFDNTNNHGDDNDDDEELDKSSASIQFSSDLHLKMMKSKQLIFGDEFAYIAKAHAKQRDAIKKQRRLQQQETKCDKSNNVPNVANTEGFNDIEDENDDYGGGFDFDGADDDSYGNNCEQDNAATPLHRSNVDFSAIDDVFTSARFDENDGDCNGNFTDAQQTFEELCQAHLRKFAKSAEIYAAETQLTKRVGQWQSGLAPILEEQEERPEFDIHMCGRKILQTVEDNLSIKKRTVTGQKKLEKSTSQNNVVDFQTVANNSEEYEVCRIFLATLMLCNRGNVTMHNGKNGDGMASVDSLQIELLESKFDAPMESFVAPSDSANSYCDKENDITPALLSMVGDESSIFGE